MNADEYRNYILGFIFFKFLSEKMLYFANKQLERAPIALYTDIPEGTEEGEKYLKVMERKALKTLGYFLKPSQLFSSLVKRGTSKEEDQETEASSDSFILEDLGNILKHIEGSTRGTESE